MSEPEFYEVKNWKTFQHYSDRNPSWIKLHRSLLNDHTFAKLSDGEKAQIVLIWLFAAGELGRIPNDAAFLKGKLSLNRLPNLPRFEALGLLLPCASCDRVVIELCASCAEFEQSCDQGNDTGKELTTENASKLLAQRKRERQRRERGGE